MPKVRKGLQATVSSSDVVVHGVDVDIARWRNQGKGSAVVVGFHVLEESLHCAIGSAGLLLLAGWRGAGDDQRRGDNDHDDSKNATHYWASRRTTGSLTAVVGKSMVSAMRRCSGKAMSKI